MLYLDLFSSTFQFNVGRQKLRKRTVLGAVLSLIVIATFLTYFVYLLLEYLGNQIDPKFRSQSFITEDFIDMDLHDDLVGFRYEYDTNTLLDDLQAEKDKTYLVFLPFFLYSNSTNLSLFPLEIQKCTSPQLSGFNCLDFSTVKNYTLTLSTKENVRSSILMFAYRCQDTDVYKTFVPNNCASVTDIDGVINNPSASFRLKFFTSQYNTTSQLIQVNYRNQYVNLQGDEFIFSDFKVQKQMTSVQEGALIQTKTDYASPVQYNPLIFNFERTSFIQKTGLTLILQITIEVDEIVQYFQIQFATFPEILAMCNSALTLLMCVGFVGRYFSTQLIKQDLFIIFLQSMYQNTFEKIMKSNKLSQIQEECSNQVFAKSEIMAQSETEGQQIYIPSILAKSRASMLGMSTSSNNENAYKVDTADEVKEHENPKISELTQTRGNYPEPDFKMSNSILNQVKKVQPTQMESAGITDQDFTPQTSGRFQFENLQLSQQSSRQPQLELYRASLSIKRPFISSEKTSIKKESVKQNNQTNPEQVKKYYSLLQKYTEKLKNVKDSKLSEQIQKNLFKICCWKNTKRMEDLGLNQIDQEIIDEQVNKSLDILQLYKEIIFLKKAIMILLSKDQFAAIQIVGCSTSLQHLEKNKNKVNLQDENIENQSNHFEQQFAISLSEESQCDHICSFLQRCYRSNNLTDIDKRILSSLS